MVRSGVNTTMKVIKNITVAIDASADDWELYDKPGRDEAAIALNEYFTDLVNQGCTRDEVENGMWPKLKEYSELGAADSEGIRFMELLLYRTFGKLY
jgi:hypothetical protein